MKRHTHIHALTFLLFTKKKFCLQDMCMIERKIHCLHNQTLNKAGLAVAEDSSQIYMPRELRALAYHWMIGMFWVSSWICLGEISSESQLSSIQSLSSTSHSNQLSAESAFIYVFITIQTLKIYVYINLNKYKVYAC